jgi:hypothetical protein
LSEFFLTPAAAITRFVRPGTSGHAVGIVLACIHVRARADRARNIARLTRSGTCRVATHVVGAEPAEAFRVRRTTLGDFFFARAQTVARLVCPRTSWHTIGIILPGGYVRANTLGADEIARFTGAATGDVTANVIETLSADAFVCCHAGLAIFEFTSAGGITRFGVIAIVGGNDVFAGGNGTAYARAAREIARSARRGTSAGTTHAVDTEIADAIGCCRATLPVVFSAGSRAVTRECAGASRQVFGRFGHVHACTDAACNIAGFAIIRACRIATNAIDAKSAEALLLIAAGRTNGFFTIAGAIANRAARLRACGIDGLGWIRRYALTAANILGALIVIDRFVIRIDRCDDVAEGITFDDFAILTGLSCRQIRPGRGQRQETDRSDASSFFTEIVGRQQNAVIRHDAPDAITRAIADERTATRKPCRFIGIRWNPRSANVFRARVIVVRNVRIEVFGERAARTVANNLLAITDILSGNGRAHRRKGLSANVVDTSALLAIVIRGQKNAIRWNIALHAAALAVTYVRLTNDTRRSCAHIWI